jgi:hypothetical protein
MLGEFYFASKSGKIIFIFCNYRNKENCKTTILAKIKFAYVRICHLFWHAAIS